MTMVGTPLHDRSAFRLVSGLWKGDREPLKPANVVRSTNFRGDGVLDFSDVVQLPVEGRLFAERALHPGDIVIERSGGGPKQPVGRVAYFSPPDDAAYFTSNFTTALRVVDRSKFDPEFVALYLHALYLGGATETLQRATTGIRNLDWQEYLSFSIPDVPLDQQALLATLIGGVRAAYRKEAQLMELAAEVKMSVMAELFSYGMRNDASKESEIGPIPRDWSIEPLAAHFSVSSGGTPSRNQPRYWAGGTVPWVKTTEVDYCVILDTEEKITETGLAESAAKLLKPNTVLMAMYGQGVTRGKVAVLGIEAACNQACAAMTATDNAVEYKYLYHFLTWRYDAIRQLAHGGQQQNLNLDIVRALPVAFPPDVNEQFEICTALDDIDAKISLHREKHQVLEELFKALLHKLMTGEIDVNDLDLSALQPAH